MKRPSRKEIRKKLDALHEHKPDASTPEQLTPRKLDAKKSSKRIRKQGV
ncbi:MAG: hypothetical protein JSS66_12845 [Armatimonadetes bacterium]|nr:hypothetical protein [Armatimonadota bacterium]